MSIAPPSSSTPPPPPKFAAPPGQPPAWHADPTGRHQHRYWDGQRWTEQVSDGGITAVDAVGATPAPVSAGNATGTSKGKWIVGVGVLAVIAIAAASSGSGDKSTGDAGGAAAAALAQPAGAAPTATAKKVKAKTDAAGNLIDKKGRPNVATEDFTPSVSADRPVTVDAITWRVESARTASTIGDEYLNDHAKGIYVIVNLSATSSRKSSADLFDNFKLTSSSGATYDPTDQVYDSDKDLLLEDVQPGLTTRGRVVFDVPPAALQSARMEFTELGFGDTKGFIALPSL